MTVEAPIAPPPAARTGHRHARRVRRLPSWIAIVLWVVLAPLAVAALMRIFAWDRFEFFAVVNTISLFVYLPAWVVAVVAVIGRRWYLAGAAILICVAQVGFVLPEFTAAQPAPSWTAHAPTIRLFDANVYNENPSMAGYISQINELKPQLLTMEEAIPSDVTQLQDSGALAGLPYRVQIKRSDPFAFLVASKYPLTNVKVAYLYGRPLVVQMDVQLSSGPQPLWVLHTIAPLPVSFSQWQGQMADINHLIRTRGTTDLLVVGDFNADWGNKGFNKILATGMVDGAAARGDALGMTWSQLEHPLPPLVRIDHVLTGPGVAVTRIATGPGPGSDHRDVRATIAFQRG